MISPPLPLFLYVSHTFILTMPLPLPSSSSLCGFPTLHRSTFTYVSLYRSRVFYYPAQNIYTTLEVQWFDICCSFVNTVYNLSDVNNKVRRTLATEFLLLERWIDKLQQWGKFAVRDFLQCTIGEKMGKKRWNVIYSFSWKFFVHCVAQNYVQ